MRFHGINRLSWLNGIAFVINLLILLFGNAIGTPMNDAAHVISALVLLVCCALSLCTVILITWMVFGTNGQFHSRITLWTVMDMYGAHVIGNIAASMVLWHIEAMAGRVAWSNISTESSWAALGQLSLYTIYMLCGGGVVSSSPLVPEARILLGMQLVINTWIVVIVYSATGATLTQHTDAPIELKPSPKIHMHVHTN